MLLTIIKVTGNSLDPVYQEGDFVVVSKIPFLLRGVKPGDVVVFRHAEYGTLIKLVQTASSEQERIFVVGLNPFSVDSRTFGPIARAALMGKVIWHIPAGPSRRVTKL